MRYQTVMEDRIPARPPVPALPWRFEAAVCRQVPFEAAIVGGGGGENERVADFGEGEKGAKNLADIVAVQRGAIEHFGSATWRGSWRGKR